MFTRTITQITIKTPNPKCRLFCCLIEFICRLEIKSVILVYFRPLLWLVSKHPSNFLTSSTSPSSPPFPVWISTEACNYTVCNTGRRGSGCVESIYRSYLLCIWPDSEPIKLFYHPKQKPRWGGDLRQIKAWRKVLYRSILKKRRHLGFGVFKVIWSMMRTYST